MKEISADFLRQEVARLGEIVVETAIYHESGMKLFSAGDAITLAHAKALHASGIANLLLLEYDEDARNVRKTLGVQRLPPRDVVAGDVLMDDVRGPSGDLLYATGTTLSDELAGRLRASAFPELLIRARRLADSMRLAQEYFAQLAPADGPGSQTKRVTRVVHVPSTTARFLLIPRARVLVSISDDPLRIFVSNALQSEGHEVIERPTPADAVEVAKRESRVTVILLDLEESLGVLPKLRADSDVKDAAIVVCAREGTHAQLYSALVAGANDAMPRPPSRDLLNEKIHGCQAMLGRRVKLAPTLLAERRLQERRPGNGETVELRDPGLTKPLPVVSGEVLDLGDGGLRMDYNLPSWPHPWAYMVHGVHPRHFWYSYAWSNPLGRDLRITMPGPSGPRERAARVSHVAPSGEYETMSLLFPDVQARHSTAIRKKF
jgi:CheY-like chemotaxis protein